VVSFAGVEFDPSKMVIRLPAKKLLKGHSITQCTAEKQSVSPLEVQKITGYLNFRRNGTTLRSDLSQKTIQYGTTCPSWERRPQAAIV